MNNSVLIFSILIITAAVSLSSCLKRGPEPINFGKDQCSYCKMIITNPNYGAEMVTDKGRVNKYDAAECLVNHIAEEQLQYKALYAIAYNDPKELYPVDSLVFVQSPAFRSPMGENLAAFSVVDSILPEYRKQLMTWEDVVTLIRNEG